MRRWQVALLAITVAMLISANVIVWQSVTQDAANELPPATSRLGEPTKTPKPVQKPTEAVYIPRPRQTPHQWPTTRHRPSQTAVSASSSALPSVVPSSSGVTYAEPATAPPSIEVVIPGDPTPTDETDAM